MKQFSLMLDGSRFGFCKLDKDGERVGQIMEWRIRPDRMSMLPAAIFYHVRKKLRAATTRAPGDWQAIADGLCEVALECDCEPKIITQEPVGVLWRKHNQPFVWFLLGSSWHSPARGSLNFRVDQQGFIHPEFTGVEKT